jgi:hypothetical protein
LPIFEEPIAPTQSSSANDESTIAVNDEAARSEMRPTETLIDIGGSIQIREVKRNDSTADCIVKNKTTLLTDPHR